MWKQIAAVTNLNLRSLPQRLAASIVVVIGVAGVVGVFITVLAMATGLERTVLHTGNPARAIVLHKAAETESFSNIDIGWVAAIAQAPGVLHDSHGTPAVCPERIVGASLPRRSGGQGGITLRGTCPAAFLVHPEWRIVAGRMFKPGLRELVVGAGAARQFAGLGIGRQVRMGGVEWTVVGHFTSGGDSHQSEALTDAPTLMSAFDWGAYSAVTVRLTSPAAFGGFRKALLSNPSLEVNVVGEQDYYRRQSQGISGLLYLVSTLVGAIMAVGALFTALNTLYSAVAARTGEIATLRAIGFGPAGVVTSVLVEALLLSILGALIGAAVAWLLFNGNSLSTESGVFDSQVTFRLLVRPSLVGIGIALACVIGLVGGLLPAIRAARLPVAVALRPV
ncbi:MAG: ABC transporter permease [Steroidobacteraceae bacterium]